MLSRRPVALAAVLAVAAALAAYAWTRHADPAPPRATPPGAATIAGVVPGGEPTGPGAGAPPADVFDLLRLEPPTRDLAELAVRMGRAEPPVARVREGRPPAYVLGETAEFWVHDIQAERYFTVTAELAAVSDHAYAWVQQGEPYDAEAMSAGTQAFSTEVYPAVREVFGSEWLPGVDGDPRLHILHHENIPGVAGYFSSSDAFTTAVEPYSNEREMFYINLGIYTPGSYDYLALLAHEFQHMIHWNQDRDEPVWMNEGLSELAALVARHQTQTGGAYLQRPDTPLMEWDAEAGGNGAHYAAAFLFAAYLRAQHGDDALGAIVAAPGNGPTGVEQGLAAAGTPRTFDETFLDWAVANRVVDAGRAGGRYGYGGASGPLAVTPVAAQPLPAAGAGLTVSQYGADYYDLTPAVAGGAREVGFRGEPTVGLLDPVPAAPGAVWWSNRGDSADSRLTARLDLTGHARAELRFRLWADLEENWDYAYFLVSTDEGTSWTRLATSRTTDADPNGNNFGSGLTGQTGGWVDEGIDLTPFVGGPVLARFEVVTDDAVNLSGLALDRLRLAAHGPGAVSEPEGTAGAAMLFEGAETDADWQPEGWLRLDPLLPQRWGLQLVVDRPGSIEVRRIDVGPDGRARVDLGGLPDDATLTLVVSGLTPATRHPAGYRLDRPGGSATAYP